MAVIVQKFGGTSVANLARINHAADIVAKTKHAGHQVVVVVSAMSGETDKLIKLATQMSESPDPREYAALIATGEQVSMALMAMALINRGLEARSYTGAQAGIMTCSQYKKARIQKIHSEAMQADLSEGRIVVVAGFQGVDTEGNITTLGRGGSDTTAVAIAAALKADECQIYTDVDGVYTTDPRIVPEAKRLDSVTFEEMLELASLGAKVLQLRSVEFAGKYRIPLRVLSSQSPDQGTLMHYGQGEKMEAFSVTGIAFSRHEAKICVLGLKDEPGTIGLILSELAAIGVNVDMLIQAPGQDGTIDFSCTVQKDEYSASLQLLKNLAKNLAAKSVLGQENLAKLSLVGAGLKSHPEVTPTLLNCLSKLKIPVLLMSNAEIKVSVLIEEQYLDLAVKTLHQAFSLQSPNPELIANTSSL